MVSQETRDEGLPSMVSSKTARKHLEISSTGHQMTEERLKEIRRRKKERYGKAYSV